jgi:hypothetical protein
MNVLAEQAVETHVKITDSWLVKYSADKNAVWEAYNRDTPQASVAQGRVQRPRAIMITSSSAGGAATYATVRGFLWGENSKDADDYTLILNYLYPLAFKRIYAQGTTARGIKIFG